MNQLRRVGINKESPRVCKPLEHILPRPCILETDMHIELYCNIELKVGECVVSAVVFRDYIIAITDRGTIYKIYPENK